MRESNAIVKILYHIGAVVMAGVIFMFTPLPDVKNDGLYHAPQSYPQLTGGYYFPTLDKSNLDAQLDIVASSLNNPKAITLFGSSELGDNRFNMPYQHFPENKNTPVVAMGRAHFPFMGAYTVLEALKPSVRPNAKVIISISPGWFLDGGMFPYAYDAYISGKVVRTAVSHDNEIFNKRLLAYLQKHKSEVNFDMELACYYGYCGGYTGWKKLTPFVVKISKRSRQWRQFLLGIKKQNKTKIQSNYNLSWHKNIYSLEELRTKELALQTNNKFAIRDGVYNSVFKHDKNPLPKEANKKLMDYGDVLLDLQHLLNLLQEKEVDALFVMQPINPYGYTDVERFYPVNNAVKAMVVGYGFKYYDMYSEPYEKGVLQDLFHPGYYGWGKINKFIEDAYDVQSN